MSTNHKMTACQLPVIYLLVDHMADRDGHAVVPAASGNDPELDSIERWPDVGRMAAGRRTPRGATLAPLEDSSAPSNEQEEGHRRPWFDDAHCCSCRLSL